MAHYGHREQIQQGLGLFKRAVSSTIPSHVACLRGLMDCLIGAVVVFSGCATHEYTAAPPVRDMPAQLPVVVCQTPRPGAMTVGEAVQHAIACSRRIEALQTAVTVAKARVRAASDIEDPEFNVAWGQRSGDALSEKRSIHPDDPEAVEVGSGSSKETGDAWRMGTRFFVPNPWLLTPRVSARKAEVRAAQADERAARWFVECEVRRLFAELNYLTSDMALAGELMRLDVAILNAVRSRVEQGAATASDVVTAIQRDFQRQNGLDQTRHRYKLAQRGLAALLDMPVTSLQIDTNTPALSRFPTVPISFAQAGTAALQHRGDVDALHWRVLAAGFAFREARNVRLPWIKEINGDYRMANRHTWGDDATSVDQETSWMSNNSDADTDEWRVGLTIDIPIFSCLKNHADGVLQTQYKLAGVNEAEGIRRATREIRDTLDELEESRLQQSRYEKDIAPLAAEMRRTLEVLRHTPNVMPEQVAATEVQVIESMRLDLGFRWRYCLALIGLESAVGAPLSNTLNAETTVQSLP